MIRCAGRSVLVAVLLLASRGAVMGDLTRVALAVLLLVVSACSPRGFEQTLGYPDVEQRAAEVSLGSMGAVVEHERALLVAAQWLRTASQCDQAVERLTKAASLGREAAVRAMQQAMPNLSQRPVSRFS